MKNRYTKVESVTEYILVWCASRSTSVSPKKLQKLLFLSYSFYLVFMNDNKDDINNRLFTNEFEAWAHGPVYPHIYRKFKKYGMNNIFIDDIKYDHILLSEDEKEIINIVLKEFSVYKAYQLENFTHNLGCWLKKHNDYGYFDICTERIEDKDIYTDFVGFVA